jgi:hypothetical protein
VTTVQETIRAVSAGSLGYERGLDTLTVTPAAEVDPVVVTMLQDACARLWRGGWQPAELHRIVLRRGHPTHADLVSDAVAAYLAQFPKATVDERWSAQARALGATVWWRSSATYLDEVSARWRSDRVAVLDVALTLLGLLAALPPIEILVPPPGTATTRDTAAAASRRPIDGRLLDRVRGLLAKAESTEYPAEAEAYTAKVQELVARHSIDEALLVARGGEATVVPLARRIGVDHPYEGEKAALLDAVARANRCHVVWSPDLGFSTVFGFDADIDAVDLLHTSLLVQAHRAMAKVEPPGGKAGKSRLKAFRQSFLVAFTVRIGQRMAGATDAALAEATDQGGAGDPTTADGTAAAVTAADLLPVLASRDEQVRETMQKMFPTVVRGRGSRIDSMEGWDSGRAAADDVALHHG